MQEDDSYVLGKVHDPDSAAATLPSPATYDLVGATTATARLRLAVADECAR